MNVAKWALVIVGLIFLILGIADIIVLWQISIAPIPQISVYNFMTLLGVVPLWRTIFEIIVGIIAIAAAFVKSK